METRLIELNAEKYKVEFTPGEHLKVFILESDRNGEPFWCEMPPEMGQLMVLNQLAASLLGFTGAAKPVIT